MSRAEKGASVRYHSDLVNEHLLDSASAIVFFLLPYSQSLDVQSALADLSYPVVTTRFPFSIPSHESVFPQDTGVTIGDRFFTTDDTFSQIAQALQEVGLQDLSGRLSVSIVESVPDGGTTISSLRNSTAVTTDRQAYSLYSDHGYHAFLFPDQMFRKRTQGRGDWVYHLRTHIDPIATMFEDRGQTMVMVDEFVFSRDTHYPPDWEVAPVPHRETLQGALNITFLDEDTALIPADTAGSLAAQTISRNHYDIITLPQSVVGDCAGAKCRTLLLPLLPR